MDQILKTYTKKCQKQENLNWNKNWNKTKKPKNPKSYFERIISNYSIEVHLSIWNELQRLEFKELDNTILNLKDINHTSFPKSVPHFVSVT